VCSLIVLVCNSRAYNLGLSSRTFSFLIYNLGRILKNTLANTCSFLLPYLRNRLPCRLRNRRRHLRWGIVPSSTCDVRRTAWSRGNCSCSSIRGRNLLLRLRSCYRIHRHTIKNEIDVYRRDFRAKNEMAPCHITNRCDMVYINPPIFENRL